MVERLGRDAVLRRGLHRDAVELREAVEVGDVLARIVPGQRREHIGGRKPRQLALRGIRIDPVLRIACVELRIDVADFGTFRQRLDELVRHLLEVFDIACGLVLQVELEAAAHAVTRDHRRSHGVDSRIGDARCEGVDLGDDIIDRLPLALAVVPVRERHEIHALRRTRTREGEARDCRAGVDFGNLCELGVDLFHDFEVARHRRSGLGAHADHDRARILVGDQSRFGAPHQHRQEQDRRGEGAPHEPPPFHEEHHRPHVFPRQRAEHGVERPAEPRREVVFRVAVLVRVGFEHQCAQGRREREGIDGRYADGDGHRQAELRIECARRAARHRHGNEDGHEDDRGGQNRRAHPFHGIGGREVRRAVARVEFRLHRFDHHDRIVHHRADGQHEGEEREQVDGEAQQRHDGERADDRHEDRNRGNERRADVLQEDVHDQYHQQYGFQQGFDDLADRGVEEPVGIAQRYELHAGGQFARDLGQHRVDLLDRLRGVRARLLVDHSHGALVSVHVGAVVVVFVAQLDVGHLFQAQHLAAGK